MLKTIESEAVYTASLTGRVHFAKRTMEVMTQVDRADFVPEHARGFAYDNGPLPIGYGQTISQPYMVALMTDLLDLTPESVVLEIGTGSGYQAAVLSRLVRQVYSIERVPELAEEAAKRLTRLGYGNIETRCANGYEGWKEYSPFDGIIVTAAVPYFPPELIEQLKPEGKLVIPIGMPYRHQELMLMTKDIKGETETRDILGVAFVPLIDDREDAV